MQPQFITLHKNAKDIAGQTFGRLTVLGAVERRDQKIHWLCKCSCGNMAVVCGKFLRSGHTQSCGCLVREALLAVNTTHDLTKHPIYRKWKSMIARCTDARERAYKDYGGRGIKVHDEWQHDVRAFYEYVSSLEHYGKSGYSLDRIDNNGNYEPGNVRWATRHEQASNTRRNIMLTHNGETKHLAEWSRVTGLSLDVLTRRIKLNWPADKMLTEPPDARFVHRRKPNP